MIHRPRNVPSDAFVIEREDDGDELEADVELSGAPAYEVCVVCRFSDYPVLPLVPAGLLANLVEQVASIEGPVHIDVVVQRIRDAWGVQRAGSRIQDAVQYAVDIAVRTKNLKRTGDFLSRADAVAVARDRSGADLLLRRPEMIAPEEWQAAIIAVVQRNFGVKKSELPAAVARWMGFSSTSAAMREFIEGELEKAMDAGRLRQQGESIEVA